MSGAQPLFFKLYRSTCLIIPRSPLDIAEASRQSSASMASPANHIFALTISHLASAHNSRFPAAIGRLAPPRDCCAGIDKNIGREIV